MKFPNRIGLAWIKSRLLSKNKNWAVDWQIELLLPTEQITFSPMDIWIRWKGDHKGFGISSYLIFFLFEFTLYNVNHEEDK